MVNRGRRIAGEEPIAPKEGARYHFELPGATQGVRALSGPEWTNDVDIANSSGHSASGSRSLGVKFSGVAPGQGVGVVTETFVPEEVFSRPGYEVTACPTLYPGQTIRARVELEGERGRSLGFRLIAQTHDENGRLKLLRSKTTKLTAGDHTVLEWVVPDTAGYAIIKAGVEARVAGDVVPGEMSEYTSALPSESRHADSGSFYLDYLRIDGVPSVELSPSMDALSRADWARSVDLNEKLASLWLRQWVKGVREVQFSRGSLVLDHDAGHGLFYTGFREWKGYRTRAGFIPNFFAEAGVGIHIQGMTYFLAAVVRRDGTAAIVEMWDDSTDLATTSLKFSWEEPLEIETWVEGTTAHAKIGSVTLSGEIRNQRLAEGGGTGLVITEGTAQLKRLAVSPV